MARTGRPLNDTVACTVCGETLDETMQGSYGACWVENTCLAHCTDFVQHCTDLPEYEVEDERVAQVLENARQEAADRAFGRENDWLRDE